jgi:hypothetical protein
VNRRAWVNRRARKISQVGNLSIAFEGLEVYRKNCFSAAEIATKVLNFRPPGPLTEKVSILIGSWRQQVTKSKRHQFDTRSTLVAGKPPCNVLNAIETRCRLGEVNP